MDRHSVGIVIPAFNESTTISPLIYKASQYGTVIVVDDGSSDGTDVIAEESGAVVVKHPSNLGYDNALNTGFKNAYKMGCKYIVTLDADGQHDPSLIPELIKLLENGADLVVGIRNRHQRFSELLFSIISSWKWGVKDPLCGLKAYRSNVYSELGHFDCYNSVGTELLIFAANKRKKIIQIPVFSGDRKDCSRFGNIFSSNFRVLRAIFLSFTNKH